MAVPTLRTDRLILRPLVLADAAALHAVFTDDEVMRYWWRAPHASFRETEEAVARNAEEGADCTCWAITTDGKMALGWINLREKRAGVAEVGYILARSVWGRGYAKEALAAAVTHGFGAMELRRIAADVDPDNTASIALLHALGFLQEGHLRGEWETHIGVRDSLIFSLLASAWAAEP